MRLYLYREFHFNSCLGLYPRKIFEDAGREDRACAEAPYRACREIGSLPAPLGFKPNLILCRPFYHGLSTHTSLSEAGAPQNDWGRNSNPVWLMKNCSIVPLSSPAFLGLDVAKAKADVCLLGADGRVFEGSFANSRAGYAGLLEWLEARAPKGLLQAGLESTGPYSRPWCELLHAAGRPVSLLNPARPRAYAQACGQRNKTDRVDARLLAQFVADQKPALWTPPDPARQELKELVRRREDLLALRQAEKNRVESARAKSVRDSLARSIKSLDREISQIEAELDSLAARCPALQKEEKLLRSIKGIGKITARKIMAELPEVSRFQSAREAAAYAGLSPRRHESGASVHKRGKLSKVGNADLRKALYLPAITAIKHNEVIKAFAARLRANGKPEMVIIAAAMRKLLHIAFGVLKHQKPFDPAYANA